MNNEKIEIPIKHIFEQLAYYLAQSKLHSIQSERERFALQAQGVQMLLNRTTLCPHGTPLIEFEDSGVYLPEDWNCELEDQDYWPIWYKEKP